MRIRVRIRITCAHTHICTRVRMRHRGLDTSELRHPRNCLHTLGLEHRYALYLTCTGCPKIINAYYYVWILQIKVNNTNLICSSMKQQWFFVYKQLKFWLWRQKYPIYQGVDSSFSLILKMIFIWRKVFTQNITCKFRMNLLSYEFLNVSYLYS